MSLAINREEINDIVYFGYGVPRQLTVVSASQYFEPEFATAWAEFDPARAQALFDEMGLVDRDGDGRRERLDGKPLQITLEYMIGETPKQVTLDLVTAHWREVGVNVNLKQISGSLQRIRARAGLMDMTIWHADRNADILFPIEPYWYVPTNGGWEQSQWSKWTRWYFSDGALGWEPPAQIKELIGWWETLRRTTDEDERIAMGKKILRSQAENSVGTRRHWLGAASGRGQPQAAECAASRLLGLGFALDVAVLSRDLVLGRGSCKVAASAVQVVFCRFLFIYCADIEQFNSC